MRRRLGLVAFLSGLLLAACSSSGHTSQLSSSTTSSSTSTPANASAPWPAPSDPMTRTRAAGLIPQAFETLQHHVHAHLDVFVNAARIAVPAGIGINTRDPGVHKSVTDGQPAFGGISSPCAHPCISPLHTHDVTGILHTESPTNVDNTLGQFFTEWGVRLDANCVGGYCIPQWRISIYVDGHSIGADPPQSITLTDHKEIAIIIGSPPNPVPATADFSNA
jgi:hypothetical protein